MTGQHVGSTPLRADEDQASNVSSDNPGGSTTRVGWSAENRDQSGLLAAAGSVETAPPPSTAEFIESILVPPVEQSQVK
ncbi:MAG: hypothetical protein M5R42_05400 [Rhodocyclaceae bacterium]|nr:hypothetical protein [Rhodocyclaceae bacterium]